LCIPFICCIHRSFLGILLQHLWSSARELARPSRHLRSPTAFSSVCTVQPSREHVHLPATAGQPPIYAHLLLSANYAKPASYSRVISAPLRPQVQEYRKLSGLRESRCVELLDVGSDLNARMIFSGAATEPLVHFE
jgi:hypothetical protein